MLTAARRYGLAVFLQDLLVLCTKNQVLRTSCVLQGSSSNAFLNKYHLRCATECIYVARVVSV